MTLFTVTLSGAKRNVTSEDHVQALELATKGIDRISTQINSDLTKSLGTDGLTRSDFISMLERTLDNYKLKGTNNLNIANETGSYITYVESYENAKNQDGKENPLKKIVTLKSKGVADGQEREITTTIEFGAQSVLQVLKYAVGANAYTPDENIPNRNRVSGDGNLFLHGGVSITGDFKVDRNLITTNRGYAYLNGEKWISSLYPSSLPATGQIKSHLVLGGHVYTFSDKPTYNNHISQTNFSSYKNVTNNLQEAFNTGQVPVKTKSEQVREDIKISEKRNLFRFNDKSPGTSVKIPEKHYTNWIQSRYYSYFQNNNWEDEKIYANGKTDNGIFGEKDELNFYGNNSFGSFSTNGNLIIRNNTNSFRKTYFKNGAYVGGDLIIGDTNNSSYNSNTYEKIQIDGPMFVDGNVTFRGVNGQFNVILYVTGNVTVEYSVINGLGSNGSLIIFAEGDIKFRNNSVNEDTPSNIKGFFYSKQAMEIFGVGSNIRIEGGVSGRRIVLNAIRGRAKNYKFDSNAQKITNNDYFEGVNQQSKENSRLQIIYDNNIMETWSDLNKREPKVTSVDAPRVIDRYVK